MKFGKVYFVIFLLFFLITEKVLAQSNWQLVVVPKGNLATKQNNIAPQVYLDITRALSTQLVNDNFTVFDQSLLNLNNCINKTCDVISDNKLLSLAQVYNYKSQQLAVNLAIVYQIEIFEETISNVRGVRFNFSSYLVDLDSGERVESYSDSKRYNDLTANCEGDCFTRWQAKKAYQLAQDAGYILALKINRLPKRYRYELAFSRFNSSELKAVTTFLNSISENKTYISLSDFTIKGSDSNNESNKLITLTSSYPASELNQLLQKEFEQQSLTVLIDYRSKLSKFTIVKSTSPIPIKLLSFILIALFLGAFIYYCFYKLKQQSSIKKVKHAIAAKEYYLAYSLIDKQLKNKNIKKSVVSKLGLLRKNLNEYIVHIQGNVVADKALAGTHFFTEKQVDLCQTKSDQDLLNINNHQLSLGYKYLDDAGKQCQFIYKNNHFYLLDQGSKYGCQYNDTQLLQGRLVQVETNSRLFIANDISQALKACQLMLNLSQYDSSALVMSLNSSPLQFLDSNDLALVWPDWVLDLNKTWVMLGERLALGTQDKNIIDIGCINGSEAIAYLSYDSGYFIEPVNRKATKLKMNSQEIYAKVPIDKNALISLDGCEFSLNSKLSF